MAYADFGSGGDEARAATPALPSNEEAEQALLGAVLVNNEVMDMITGIVVPEDFIVPVHGRIFEAIERCMDHNRVANPVSLKVFFEKDKALEDVGGAGYLARLAGAAATIINGRQYAEEIAELARRRRLIEMAEDVIDAAGRGDAESSSIIAEATLAMDEMQGGGDKKAPRKLGDVMNDAVRYSENAREGKVKLLRTGIAPLDRDLGGGLRPGWEVIIGGATSMGKTSLLVSVLKNLALAGWHGILYSLEMPGSADNPEIGIKFISQLSAVPTDILMQGSAEDFIAGQALGDAAARFHSLPLIIDDNPAVSASYIAAKSRAIKRRWGGRLDYIAIDYLQLMDHGAISGARSRVQAIGDTTAKLKQLAKELEVPIIVLSQLSREVEKRADKRPVLSDLRESGNIEQDADVVLFAFREHYYLSRMTPDAENVAKHEERVRDTLYRGEIIAAKIRMGAIGRIDVRFDPATQTWHDGNYDREYRR